MAKKMLIDATHAEETRVVVVDGNKVEEFDFESDNKRQLSGNIYLAKVTRVEPSLQAAFVDYGGNRHGFLAFSEIHPDYYQIPIADRQALMAEEKAYTDSLRDEDDAETTPEVAADKPAPKPRRTRTRSRAAKAKSDDAVESRDVSNEDLIVETAGADIPGMGVVDLGSDEDGRSDLISDRSEPAAQEAVGVDADAADASVVDVPTAAPESLNAAAETPTPVESQEIVDAPVVSEAIATDVVATDVVVTEAAGTDSDVDASGPDENTAPVAEIEADEDEGAAVDDDIESVADDDSPEDISPPRRPRARRYKIQEVIKVRQILLVQVVKEERGNKGAALTTYLSLAGRYCVLMPNTARGGGISRKITDVADRKKLKQIASEIDVPEGAGLIVRTAGAKRTKAEIKRDYEYLQRLWEQVRELTLKSVAPAKIYAEGDLIKRSIRDLYNRDIDEVFVEGDSGYRTAKDFMKMIMPSHAKNVKHYVDPQPLFARFQVETYLAEMFNPTVRLKSGGYIVIDVTEALVAVDVNSGKSTKEGSIEDTALKTNLEAAEEVARQMRLRDLAGLLVIDFIDMEERKNNAAVEKRLKDKLKTDRARIQVGRISGFGLLEMSRQRLRPGMIEATTQPCSHCHGTGLIRSDDSLALSILRELEEEGVRDRSREVLVKAPISIVNYLINAKRDHIAQIEGRYGLSVRVEADPKLINPDFTVEKFKTATRKVELSAPVISSYSMVMDDPEDELDVEVEAEDQADEVQESDESAATATAKPETGEDDTTKPKKRRRRRRRRRNGSGGEGSDGDQFSDEDGEGGQPDGEAKVAIEAVATTDADAPVTDEAPEAVVVAQDIADTGASETDVSPVELVETPIETLVEAEVQPEAQPEAVVVPEVASDQMPVAEVAEMMADPVADILPVDVVDVLVPSPIPEPVAAPELPAAPEPEPEPAPEPQMAMAEPANDPEPIAVQDDKPKRRGWWSSKS